MTTLLLSCKTLIFWNHRPNFDSPSIFCRLLDKDKGGFFSIQPPESITYTTKQQYLPSRNILQTRFLHADGVVEIIDFFPRPKDSNQVMKRTPKQTSYREGLIVQDELKRWLTRRVECVRGSMDLGTYIPAFNYKTILDIDFISYRCRNIPGF